MHLFADFTHKTSFRKGKKNTQINKIVNRYNFDKFSYIN